MSITFRNSEPGIASAIPIIALRLGLLGGGCWYLANSLVGPSPTHQLSAPPFQPVVEMPKAIIHNPVANDVLHHGSLVCVLVGASVFGLRRAAFYWDVRRGKNGKGDGE